MVYVNIFRDQYGTLHYSTEEFSIHQDKLGTLEEVLQDAIALETYGLSYISTLSADNGVSAFMRMRLKETR